MEEFGTKPKAFYYTFVKDCKWLSVQRLEWEAHVKKKQLFSQKLL